MVGSRALLRCADAITAVFRVSGAVLHADL